MYCKKCGNQLSESEKFCRICGEPIPMSNNQNNYQQQPNNINYNNNLNNEFVNTQPNIIQQQFNYSNVNSNMTGNMYKLTLSRKKNFVGCLVAFTIYIDNQKVGKIKNGETIQFDITAGNHQISINKNNAINIMINGDTTADVVVFAANNFGITNINGQGINNLNNQIDNNYIEKSIKKANLTLALSIILPIISVILFFTSEIFINAWIYGIIIGYAIVNTAGLNGQKDSMGKKYKSLQLKNIIAIVISAIAAIVTAYISVNN